MNEDISKLLTLHSELSAKQPDALNLLRRVYKDMFGEAMKKQCGDCVTKTFQKIQKFVYLQSQNNSNFNLKEMKKHSDRLFVIKKGKMIDLFGDTISELSTDLQIAKALAKFPNLIKHFEKFPKDENGELDLSGIDLEAKENSTAIVTIEPAAPPIPLNNLQEVKGDDKTQQNTEQKTDLKVVKTDEPIQTKEPVIKTATEPAANVTVPATKPAETGTKPAPHKAKATRLPEVGETIANAAKRFDVSERTIERDMKAAGIDVKAHKEATENKSIEIKPSEQQKDESGSTVQTTEKKPAEVTHVDEDGKKYIDFVVTEEWLKENAEDAAEAGIVLGETIQIEVEENDGDEAGE